MIAPGRKNLGARVRTATCPDTPLWTRFWRHVQRTDGCWLWTGTKNIYGHGVLTRNHKQLYAHRIAYDWFVGPLLPGLVIDHVRARGCLNRNCVNPEHLEQVTPSENVVRGLSFSTENRRKTHCMRGHPFDGNNLYRYGTRKRVCKTCRKATKARYLARKAGAA